MAVAPEGEGSEVVQPHPAATRGRRFGQSNEFFLVGLVADPCIGDESNRPPDTHVSSICLQECSGRRLHNDRRCQGAVNKNFAPTVKESRTATTYRSSYLLWHFQSSSYVYVPVMADN
jgi:hypothetical protein